MLTLAITVFLVLFVSAICSMTEAALYAVPWTAIEHLRNSGTKTGKLLYELRTNIDRPITAVLTLNTIANTAGAAIAGALAADLFGDASMPWFAALLTVLILAFGEIFPKTLGVAWSVPLAKILARPLALLIHLMLPLIWLTGVFIRLITPTKSDTPLATEDDIRAITSLTLQAGHIKAYEESTISNILSLNKKRVHDIMTPRTVVFSLPETMSVAEAYAHPRIWQFSRIPVYADNNEDIIGIVLRRRVAQYTLAGEPERTLASLMLPVRFVLESQTLDRVLLEFLDARQHLFVVLDEYGGLAGVIALEDVIEEMLGREIVDESDAVVDMRDFARLRREALRKNTPHTEHN